MDIHITKFGKFTITGKPSSEEDTASVQIGLENFEFGCSEDATDVDPQEMQKLCRQEVLKTVMMLMAANLAEGLGIPGMSDLLKTEELGGSISIHAIEGAKPSPPKSTRDFNSGDFFAS